MLGLGGKESPFVTPAYEAEEVLIESSIRSSSLWKGWCSAGVLLMVSSLAEVVFAFFL